MTREEAIALAKSGFWKDLSALEIALFQLTAEKLCMPFEVFHRAVERVLGRGVYTHEFAHPYALIAELLGEAKRPSFDEILAKLPASAKTILVKAP
jgi:hypothetical protein